jgi:glycosyltransferase involved in cell wall biosynthesis
VVAIIPARDEQQTIADVVSGILPQVRRVIVVDNGSSDDTEREARRVGADVVSEPRRGYGAACLAGIATAPEADVLLFLDGDGSDDAGQAPELLAPILRGEADLVVGSRLAGSPAPATHPWHAIAGTRLCVGLMNLLVGTRATDLGPFRAISASALARLGMRDRDYGWTVEMQLAAAHAGLRVVEVPVAHRSRRGGRSKVSGTVRGTVGAAVKIIVTILRHAWSRRRGA